MTKTILLAQDGRGVATLTLNRPDKHNALSAQMISDLSAAARQLGADPSVRVVVLAGAGSSFCAGADLGWMRDQMTASAQTRRTEAQRLADMLRALHDLPKPLIAKVQGNAFGGGIGLACVCDVAIGADAARFGLTETRLGLIPATIGPYVLARLGNAMARRVVLSSRLFDATEAAALGIIARAVPLDALDSAVEAEIAPYLACAPGAVAAAKQLIRTLSPKIDDAVIAQTIDALVQRWDSPEAAEGITAFFDKRSPSWKV